MIVPPNLVLEVLQSSRQEYNTKHVYWMGNEGSPFSINKAYTKAMEETYTQQGVGVIWMINQFISRRIRCFIWKWSQKRLLTKEHMIRRNIIKIQQASCPLCNEDKLETLNHLFFRCSATRRVWQTLERWNKNGYIHTIMDCGYVHNILNERRNHRSRDYWAEIIQATLVWGLSTIWDFRNASIFWDQEEAQQKPNIGRYADSCVRMIEERIYMHLEHKWSPISPILDWSTMKHWSPRRNTCWLNITKTGTPTDQLMELHFVDDLNNHVRSTWKWQKKWCASYEWLAAGQALSSLSPSPAHQLYIRLYNFQNYFASLENIQHHLYKWSLQQSVKEALAKWTEWKITCVRE